MARLNTKLESEGAEFLVLGELLIRKIPSYKTYTNMPGYDLVSFNPDGKKLAKIQVKSRWHTGEKSFPLKNFDFDFLVAVFLNRGSKDGKKEILPPQYYIFPLSVINKAPRTNDKWSKINITKIPKYESYANNWDPIIKYLRLNM